MTTAFRGLDRLLDAALGEISETGTRCPDLLFCIVSIYPGGQTSFSVSRSLLHVLHALDKSLCRRSRGSPAWTWRLGKYTRYGGTDELNWYPRS
jgi:hypothetical protein